LARSVIVTAYLPVELADEVDRTAQAEGVSRSKLIASSLAKMLEGSSLPFQPPGRHSVAEEGEGSR
jgi:hypothetical protein